MDTRLSSALDVLDDPSLAAKYAQIANSTLSREHMFWATLRYTGHAPIFAAFKMFTHTAVACLFLRQLDIDAAFGSDLLAQHTDLDELFETSRAEVPRGAFLQCARTRTLGLANVAGGVLQESDDSIGKMQRRMRLMFLCPHLWVPWMETFARKRVSSFVMNYATAVARIERCLALLTEDDYRLIFALGSGYTVDWTRIDWALQIFRSTQMHKNGPFMLYLMCLVDLCKFAVALYGKPEQNLHLLSNFGDQLKTLCNNVQVIYMAIFNGAVEPVPPTTDVVTISPTAVKVVFFMSTQDLIMILNRIAVMDTSVVARDVMVKYARILKRLAYNAAAVLHFEFLRFARQNAGSPASTHLAFLDLALKWILGQAKPLVTLDEIQLGLFPLLRKNFTWQ